MLVADELVEPADHAGFWWALVVALVVVALTWNAAVIWWGRPRRVRASRPRAVDLEGVRREHLRRIDALVARVHEGTATDREAHQELSAITRSFVEVASGAPVGSMTLRELREQQFDSVAAAVGVMYPAEFEPGADRVADGEARARFDEAARRAREVVTGRWT